jgi:ornithine cyclodeaminase
MQIALLDVRWGNGAPHPGAERGPDAIRGRGLVDRLRAAGRTVDDRGRIKLPASGSPARGLQALSDVMVVAHAIEDAVASLPAASVPLLLGGDHSVALGSIPAMAAHAKRQGRPFFLLWIDAHPDCHTLATTETGNLHGTPLAYGLGVPGFAPAIPARAASLAPANILGLGIRSVDASEAALIDGLGLDMIGPGELRGRGLKQVLQPFLDRVASVGGVLHVSLDADVLDPSIAPGVGTPVSDGLLFEEVDQILRMVSASGVLGGMEIVEVNPSMDRDDATAECMVALAAAAFGRSAIADPIPIAPPARKSVPSAASLVPFLSVDAVMRLVHDGGLERFILGLATEIEQDFRRWPQFQKSARYAAHSVDGVIELMPAADSSQFSFKYVNGHPSNANRGRQTVAAFGVLADVGTGYPILISEMTFLTALRTAATSALAARHLARPAIRTMAIIGNGAQSEFQAVAFKALLGVDRIRLFDIDPSASVRCAENLRRHGFARIEVCTRAEAAVLEADIITTATADKRSASVLSPNMVGAGVHINAVGGDCPGKTEIHPDVLRRGSIFVEHEPQTRIEGDIQQLSADHPVTELWRVIAGEAEGRRNADEITIFDSVGFAIEDFATLRYVHGLASRTGSAEALDLIADPDDPRDLFGMLMRAA